MVHKRQIDNLEERPMRVDPDEIKPGDQIAYIPSHVIERFGLSSDVFTKSGVECGFVATYVGGEWVYCRYFWPGKTEMRTQKNSESTRVSDLYVLPEKYRVDQAIITSFLDREFPNMHRKRWREE